METRNVNIHQIPDLHGPLGRRLLACGLWLRLGFVGASAVAIGVIQLFGHDASPLSAFVLTMGGGALGILSWRRAHAALTDVDQPANAPSVAVASGGARTVVGA